MRQDGRLDLEELGAAARSAAEAGARVATSWQLRRGQGEVWQKAGPRDLVSQADLDTERTIRDVLQTLRPGDAVLGEEHGHSSGDTPVRWIIDPIDGTTSYLYGRSDWSVSVAAEHLDGTILCGAVAEPAHQRICHATRGGGAWKDGTRLAVNTGRPFVEALVEVNFGGDEQRLLGGAMVDALLPSVRDLRRGGSAAVSMVHVATGLADAVWSPGIQAWDGAAGLLLVHEAGGVAGDLTGPSDGRWPPSGDVLAAPESLWESLRSALEPVYQHPLG